jgi:hypothetical protein
MLSQMVFSPLAHILTLDFMYSIFALSLLIVIVKKSFGNISLDSLFFDLFLDLVAVFVSDTRLSSITFF